MPTGSIFDRKGKEEAKRLQLGHKDHGEFVGSAPLKQTTVRTGEEKPRRQKIDTCFQPLRI